MRVPLLLRVVEVLSTRPVEERQGVSIRNFMTPDPVVVALSDVASVAALLMWNRGLKSLPVVTSAHGGRLAGCLRAETMMQQVVQTLLATRQAAHQSLPSAGRVESVSA